ncbi:UDP-glucose:protein N-beta-glucosyltransferase [Neisseria perflava]|uniref:UDP-glucose:protein N-beta-glucosyltransferase n=1 Tax=Neisseria perflava TaxID=33053 RepID=UPI00209F209B|nr:adhesin [Neisseria perflava]MCP1660905.1 hypothetical protein [Neisseria perflava]MCP1773177.1 hypothetical protein [Neisseria perflava]
MTEQTEKKEPVASLTAFEQAVRENNHEVSCRELIKILQALDRNFGGIQGIEAELPAQLKNMPFEGIRLFATRMAAAVTTLFQQPDLTFSEQGVLTLLTLQRWLALIFATSPYINADHILRSFDTRPAGVEKDPNSISLPAKNPSVIQKFFILYFPESNINLDFEVLWKLNPDLCASLCFALLSPRFTGTIAAHGKHSMILKWFPPKLKTIQNLNKLPSRITHDVYMHSSYVLDADKHRIKESINEVIRRHLLEGGWKDRDVKKIGRINGKPVMVVLLEHFHSAHSIFRTHSTSLRAARKHFYIVGIGSDLVDKPGREVFDVFHQLDRNKNTIERLQFVRSICERVQPAVFYMPSIGMDLTTIFASNTRLAPIQAIALGHPATTHSQFIEYVIVEDDYVGSEDCFSETLLRLPKDALPYVPSALAPEKVDYKLREHPEVVQIGVASTTMKLNPYFLDACRQIRDKAKVKVHFHFAMGQSGGISHLYIERFLKSFLGNDVTAYPQQPYLKYLDVLRECDMMINPFPFGNTNGIIDMVTLGLVGICKTGPEVHEHIDEGLFKRLGLPDWLVAHTVEEYIERAIRLAENHEERLALRRQIIENNGLQTLFTGDPSPMGEVLMEKVSKLEGYKGDWSQQLVNRIKS